MDRREMNHEAPEFDEARMVITLYLLTYVEDGDVENGPHISEEGEPHEFPAKFELCPTCDGKGSHVNPSIDAHGITQEEFDQDPDFEEMYRGGAYDITCVECEGKRVVPVVDVDNLSNDDKKLHEKIRAQQEERAEDESAYAAEVAAERRMGA